MDRADVARSLLTAKGIEKRFSGVVALKGVDFQLEEGEIHALVGENGAGKSTLVKILSGVYSADNGEVFLKGRRVQFHGPRDAQSAGISTVHQELTIVPHLTIGENVMLGAFPCNAVGTIRTRALSTRAAQHLANLGFEMDTQRLASDTTAVERQVIQIAHALLLEASVLIMDEPGAVLSPKELARLFEILRGLKQRKIGIIYISHRLQEVFELCDRVTVMKDGRVVGSQPTSGLDIPDIVRMMVGKEVGDMYPKREQACGETVLEVTGFSGRGFSDVHFEVRRGEVLGIGGFSGCGRSEVLQALFGAVPTVSGRIELEGREVAIRAPGAAIRLGIGLLTQDRKRDGLLLDLPVSHNVTMASWGRLHTKGLLRERREREIAAGYIAKLDVRPPDPEMAVRLLSGGNQQKVCVAKWLATEARLLLFDEPTRGVDVGARTELYRLIASIASEGKTVVLSSSDFRELAGLCDRVLVMAAGRIVGELTRSELSEEAIVEMATLGRETQR